MKHYISAIAIWIFNLLALLFFVSGCGHVDVKFNNPFSEPTIEEEAETYFAKTKWIMRNHIALDQLAECGLKDLDKFPRPNVVAVESFKDGEQGGSYDASTFTVTYVKSKPQILVHEFMHYFNSLVSDRCRDEFAAYFAAATYRVAEREKKLKRQVLQYRRLNPR